MNTRQLYPKFIRAGCYLGGIYLCYEIINAMRYERKLGKLEALKLHKKRLGQPFEETPETKALMEYKENHYGHKIRERMRTQHFLEEQIKYQIEEKESLRKKLVEEHNEEEIGKIEEDLKKLNDVFKKVSKTKIINEQPRKQETSLGLKEVNK